MAGRRLRGELDDGTIVFLYEARGPADRARDLLAEHEDIAAELDLAPIGVRYSSFLIDLMENSAGAIEFAKELESSGATQRVPAQVVYELFVGVGYTEMTEQEISKVQSVLDARPTVNRLGVKPRGIRLVPPVKIGLGAAVGLGTSAVWSVWEIERAETRAEIKRMEQAMLTDLDDTRIESQQRGARLLHATASGLGPLIGVLVPLSPFVVAGQGAVLTMVEATVAAVVLGVGVLSVFGAYMGSISGQRWYVSAARMGLAGLVVALLNLVLPG